MTNRNLKKRLALALSFVMIITALSTGIASAETGYTGTPEEGYTGSGSILDATPNTQFKNLDFEDGLSYFQKDVAGDYASVVTEENGNKALKLSCDNSVNSWKRFVISYPITIENAVVGSEFGLRFDVKVENFEKGGSNKCQMNLRDKDGYLMFDNGQGQQPRCNITSNTDEYVTYSGKWIVKNVEEGKTKFILYFFPNVGDVVADIYIDNISIGYQPDPAFTTNASNKKSIHYPPITEGTETLVANVSNGYLLYDVSEYGYYGGYNVTAAVSNVPVKTDAFKNTDFENGYTDWNLYNSWSQGANLGSISSIDDFDGDGDKELKLNPSSGATTQGIVYSTFPLTGLKTNDRIILYYEYKWLSGTEGNTNLYGLVSSKTSGEIAQSNGSAYLQTKYSENGGTPNNGTHTALSDGWYAVTTIGDSVNGTSGTYATIKKDDAEATVWLGMNLGGAVLIDNLKILVSQQYSIGDSGLYSGWRVYDSKTGTLGDTFYENDGITVKASPYGTAETGITTTANVSTYPSSILYKSSIDPVASLNSGSLFCWGPTQQDNSNVATHSGAEAITFNDDGSFNLNWIAKSNMGISSVYFALPENIVKAYEGKDAVKYAIWFDYVNTATENAASNNNSLEVTLSNNETTDTYKQNANKVALSGTAVTKNGVDNIAQISFKVWSNYYQYKISNFTLGYVDLGGMEKELYVYQDGTPRDAEMGDANADGEIDLRDLIRMKKRAANENQAIYLAAADMDGDGVVGAIELSSLRKTLIA